MLNQKLSILLILVEPPLPFANAGSRWFHVLLKVLDRRGHHVDILVVSGVDKDIHKAKSQFAGRKNFFIFPFGKNKSFLDKIKTVLFPHRYIFTKDFYLQMNKLNPKNYDIVHIEQTWAGWAGFDYAQKTLINVHFLLSIDLAHSKPKNLKDRLLFKTWFNTEKFILKKYPFIRSCSQRIEKEIRSFTQPEILETVPFSLDLSLYSFIPTEKRQNKEPLLTLIGNMSWHPSISAAERLLKDLWPQISQQVPEAKLRIVGWSARQALKNYLNLPRVEILENVPDIQPYFEQASVLVYAPARGSGMKMKVLESLAFGVPVVTTSEGAEEIPAIDMLHMGLCEDNQGLIDRTVKILKDFSLQEKLRVEGRKLIEFHCGEEKTVSQIEEIYKKILNSPNYQK